MEFNDREIWDGEWIGVETRAPLCIDCQYSNGRFCTNYNKDRLDVPFPLFNCPGFVEKEDLSK